MERRNRLIKQLLEDRILEEEVTEALQSQDWKSIEAFLLTEERVEEKDLLQSLAIALNIPPAGYGQGLFIERDLFREVGPELIEEYEFLPVRRRMDGGIDIVVVGPLNDLARSIIEKALGAKLHQYIWPVVRFAQARHFFLGHELLPEIRNYLVKYPVSLGYASNQKKDLDQILSSSQGLDVGRWSSRELHGFVENCFDRDTLLKTLLSYGEEWLSHRAILVMGRSKFQVYFVEEWPKLDRALDDVSALRALKIPGADPDLIQMAESLRLDHPGTLGLGELFGTLQAEDPFQAILAPIRIGNRTAMAMVGIPRDRKTSIRLEEVADLKAFNSLKEMTVKVGEQLEEIIKRGKQGALPPRAERIPPLPEPRERVGLELEESLVEMSIARRKGGRHRWEIIDISHVIEEPPEFSDPGPAIGSEEDSEDAPLPAEIERIAEADSETSEEMPSPGGLEAFSNPGATTFGMPALQPNLSPEKLEPEEGLGMQTQAPSEPLKVDQSGLLEESESESDLKPVSASAGEPQEEGSIFRKVLGLNIPNDASGFPMAQIFRRPRSVREKSLAASKGNGEVTEFSAKTSSVGQTVLGLGELSPISSFGRDVDSEASDAEERGEAGQETSWLDEIEEGRESSFDQRPSGTLKMNPEVARTQGFNELLGSMEVGEISSENGPNTIPVEVLEEIPPSGPIAVEIEESLLMIDSRDIQVSRAAAEHLSTAGAVAVEGLIPIFPGRLVVDRYQYTVGTMPPVSEHGPVLETLVRIGQASLALVGEYLDDPSLERRFYATYLLTELPAQGHFEALFRRLFDKDAQTRQLAQNIIHSHRHFEGFPEKIIAPLREVLEEGDDDFRLEIAADSLRRYKDLPAVPLLIALLGQQKKRVTEKLHRALREITFQSFSAAPMDWRNWWEKASEEPRWRWLVEAMDNKDDEIRMLAFNEIEQIPGLELNYHPAQPSKLRIRAQGELTEFFEAQK